MNLFHNTCTRLFWVFLLWLQYTCSTMNMSHQTSTQFWCVLLCYSHSTCRVPWIYSIKQASSFVVFQVVCYGYSVYSTMNICHRTCIRLCLVCDGCSMYSTMNTSHKTYTPGFVVLVLLWLEYVVLWIYPTNHAPDVCVFSLLSFLLWLQYVQYHEYIP